MISLLTAPALAEPRPPLALQEVRVEGLFGFSHGELRFDLAQERKIDALGATLKAQRSAAFSLEMLLAGARASAAVGRGARTVLEVTAELLSNVGDPAGGLEVKEWVYSYDPIIPRLDLAHRLACLSSRLVEGELSLLFRVADMEGTGDDFWYLMVAYRHQWQRHEAARSRGWVLGDGLVREPLALSPSAVSDSYEAQLMMPLVGGGLRGTYRRCFSVDLQLRMGATFALERRHDLARGRTLEGSSYGFTAGVRLFPRWHLALPRGARLTLGLDVRGQMMVAMGDLPSTPDSGGPGADLTHETIAPSVVSLIQVGGGF